MVEREYKRAERTYKRALKYAPNSAVTYLNLGTAYFAQSKYKQGSESLPAGPRDGSERPQFWPACQSKKAFHASSSSPQITISPEHARPQESYNRPSNYLRKALNEGFNDRKQLMEDKEFATLRTTPEFQQLLVEEHLN